MRTPNPLHLAVVSWTVFASCAPSQLARQERPHPLASASADVAAVVAPNDVGTLFSAGRLLFATKKTAAGWVCERWRVLRGDTSELTRISGTDYAVREQCDADNRPLLRVEWEFGFTGPVLGINPLYYYYDGRVITSSYIRFASAVASIKR